MAFKMNKKGFPMNSPSKNYKNPRDYRVFNWGNEADPPLDMGKKDHGPTYMKSPVKKEGEYVKDERGFYQPAPPKPRPRQVPPRPEPDMPTQPRGPKMKSSGFKMKEGSPFQRNFGVGTSPAKKDVTSTRKMDTAEEAKKVTGSGEATANDIVKGGTLETATVTDSKPTHKDITSKGGFNEKITKGIKEGNLKVYERADGSKYTVRTDAADSAAPMKSPAKSNGSLGEKVGKIGEEIVKEGSTGAKPAPDFETFWADYGKGKTDYYREYMEDPDAYEAKYSRAEIDKHIAMQQNLEKLIEQKYGGDVNAYEAAMAEKKEADLGNTDAGARFKPLGEKEGAPVEMKSGFKMKSPFKAPNVNVYRDGQEYLYGDATDPNAVVDETKKAMEFEEKNKNIINKNYDENYDEVTGLEWEISDLDDSYWEAINSGDKELAEKIQQQKDDKQNQLDGILNKGIFNIDYAGKHAIQRNLASDTGIMEGTHGVDYVEADSLSPGATYIGEEPRTVNYGGEQVYEDGETRIKGGKRVKQYGEGDDAKHVGTQEYIDAREESDDLLDEQRRKRQQAADSDSAVNMKSPAKQKEEIEPIPKLTAKDMIVPGSQNFFNKKGDTYQESVDKAKQAAHGRHLMNMEKQDREFMTKFAHEKPELFYETYGISPDEYFKSLPYG